RDQCSSIQETQFQSPARRGTGGWHLSRLPSHGGTSVISDANVAEFIAYAKAKPGRINFVSVGNGSVAHARCHFRGRICKTGRGKIGRSGASDPDGKHRHGMIACEAEKIALRRGSSQICYSKPRARSIFFRKRRQYLLAPEAGPGGFPCPAASR